MGSAISGMVNDRRKKALLKKLEDIIWDVQLKCEQYSDRPSLKRIFDDQLERFILLQVQAEVLSFSDVEARVRVEFDTYAQSCVNINQHKAVDMKQNARNLDGRLENLAGLEHTQVQKELTVPFAEMKLKDVPRAPGANTFDDCTPLELTDRVAAIRRTITEKEQTMYNPFDSPREEFTVTNGFYDENRNYGPPHNVVMKKAW